jgi:WD40 repeat protein/serine/threonine protein kinase
MYDEGMAIRRRLEELKSSGSHGKAERDELRKRYAEIDRLLRDASSHPEAAGDDGSMQPVDVTEPDGEGATEVDSPISATVAGSEEGRATQASGTEAVGSKENVVAAEWTVGDVILDEYEVTGVLGEGGMGKVYKVHHRNWDMDMAVKSPRPKILRKKGQKENFVRECHTWMDLGLHNHIVTCHYVRVLDDIPRVFAEYVDGGSLKDWITEGKLYKGGPEKSLERILDIAIQFAWGLQYSHEKGLVHQDVKPDNVMMTSDGVAKATDFGLSNALAINDEGGKRPEGDSILASYGGRTPAYCSPEQADNAARLEAGVPREKLTKLTKRTDIYSWAVSVFEMFNGSVTWPAGNVVEYALESYLEDGAEMDGPPAMPPPVAELLKRCLEQEPEDRPNEFTEIVVRLKRCFQDEIRREYRREPPSSLIELADVLNNKALSFLELGNESMAETLWKEGLMLDAHHLQCTYNCANLLWRTGRITDEDVITRLEEINKSDEGRWEPKYLEGLVYIENGDAASATKVLEEARRLAPNENEVSIALGAAKSLSPDAAQCVRYFGGHTGFVHCVCLSNDGKHALSGGRDQTIRLWEVETAECMRTFEGHGSVVTSVSWSADGRWVLSGSWDGTARLWNAETGECEKVFLGHTGDVYSVALSADGSRAFSGSLDNTIRMWDAQSGESVRVFEGHMNGVFSVSLGTDERRLLSGSQDGTLIMWDVDTGKCVRVFEGHTNWVTSVFLSVDGRWALSGSSDKTMRLWEVDSGVCERVFHGHTQNLCSVCLSIDGRWALSGGEDNTMRLWEVETGKCSRTFKGDSFSYNSVLFSGDSRWALSGGDSATLSGANDDYLCLWRLIAFEQRRPAPSVMCRVASWAEYSNLSQKVNHLLKLAQAAMDSGLWQQALEHIGTIRDLPGHERNPQALTLRSRVGGHCVRKGFKSGWHRKSFNGHPNSVTAVSVSPDGRLVLSGSTDGTTRLWDAETGEHVRSFDGHLSEVTSVVFSADGRTALTGSSDRSLRYWNVDNGKCIRTFEGHTSTVNSVDLSIDNRRALSGGYDKTVRIWDVETGTCIRTLDRNTDSVVSVSISRDGRHALIGCGRIVSLWNMESGHRLGEFIGHAGTVESVALSFSGRQALSGGTDKTVRLWDVDTCKSLRVFEGHESPVTSVCLSSDGRWALSGSWDKTIRLWDATTGQCVRIFEGHAERISSVSLSANGRWALSGSGSLTEGFENAVRMWELDWDYEIREPVAWDEGIRPYFENYLLMCTPNDGMLPNDREATEEDIQRAFKRTGSPDKNLVERDFEKLLETLQCVGYGWLRREDVETGLERMMLGENPSSKTHGVNRTDVGIWGRPKARERLEVLGFSVFIPKNLDFQTSSISKTGVKFAIINFIGESVQLTALIGDLFRVNPDTHIALATTLTDRAKVAMAKIKEKLDISGNDFYEIQYWEKDSPIPEQLLDNIVARMKGNESYNDAEI